MKILLFIGTRPEAIKIMSLIYELKKNNFKVEACATGQHAKLLDDVFNVFNFKPNYKYKILKNHNLNNTFSNIVNSASEAILKSKPKLVIVHGDTLNTAACAIAAFNLKIKIAHLEAGLRSFDKNDPWPEEVYRRVVTKISDYHFAPTIISKNNLLKESIESKNIFITGNTVIDSLKLILDITKKSKVFQKNFNKFLDKIKFDNNKFNVVVTCHRREQIGKNISFLCRSIEKISNTNNVKVYFILHHNPKIIEPVKKYFKKNKNILLIKPLKYDFFTNLLKLSNLVITDSGGIQEEITLLNKKCLVNRSVTERIEVIDNKNIFLVGADSAKLIEKFKSIYRENNINTKKTLYKKYYGNGNASKKICQILKKKINV